MAIGFYNQDSSFFEIKVAGDTVTDILKNRLISFSVTEEMNRIFSGSIETFDPNSTINDRLLFLGKAVRVSWGYKRPDTSIIAAFAKKDNPDEVMGQFQRSEVNAFVTNVSGSGDADGVITYTANFMGTVYNTGGKPRTFINVSRRSMIITVLSEMGILAANAYISFYNMDNTLNENTAKTQYESNFRFLNRMALDHGVVFSVGSNMGVQYAVFAEYTSSALKEFANRVGSSQGSQLTLNYKEGTPNVESYSFSQEASNATGDSVQIMNINGVPTMRRFRADTLTVTDCQINMDKLNKDMRAQSYTNVPKFMAKLLAGKSLDDPVVKPYFTSVTSTTAPQGYGWTAKVRMLGNPLVTAPMRVKFGKGFPSVMSIEGPGGGMGKSGVGPKLNFWIRAVTHTIDESGYHMDLDIADALTITGGSFVG